MAKINHTFYIILGTLNYGPKSGYDIKKAIEGSTGRFWKVNCGQIYPLLKTMVDEGYAILVTGNNENKLDRKEYCITPKGKDAFMEWLAQPINFSNPQGNELLVKLFFGMYLPTRINITHLSEYKKKCIANLAKILEIQKNIEPQFKDHPHLDYAMIAIRHGQMVMQSKIDWCDECIQRLNKRLEEEKQV